MNYYEKPTLLHETANTEAIKIFAEHLKQFKAHCQSVHKVEGNLTTLGDTAFNAALESSGRVIQTDDGAEWQHGVDLMENAFVCHRRTTADLEFAVVERMPLKSGERDVLMDSDHSVREVLKTFAHDQRQLLNIWKDDVVEQVKEHLAEKYPHQDMSIVAGSFEIKMARDISERQTIAQNHSRGVRI
ncbi:MAG: hypothetical protein ACLP2Y_08800 [Limisphaerales bacterium]